MTKYEGPCPKGSIAVLTLNKKNRSFTNDSVTTYDLSDYINKDKDKDTLKKTGLT